MWNGNGRGGRAARRGWMVDAFRSLAGCSPLTAGASWSDVTYALFSAVFWALFSTVLWALFSPVL
jgi:hypothetical protein